MRAGLMMGVLMMVTGVARADVQLVFQGTLDWEGCIYGNPSCPATETATIVLATPIVPDPIEVFGFTGPDVFVIEQLKYESRVLGPAADTLFTRGGNVEGVQEGFVTDAFDLHFSAPNGFFTGPITAPVLTPGMYLGGSIYLPGEGIYDGTVTISDVGVATATPEPGTWGLVGTGLLGLVGVARRRLA